MKKPLAVLLILFFTFASQAQTKSSGDAKKSIESNETKSAAPTNETEADENAAIVKSGGKVILPPEKTAPVRIPLFTAPPVIDGKLDDEAWKQAAVFKDFYQTAPGDNIAPSKPTIAYVGYDEKNLYIAFKCYDERDKIRATVAKRDEVFGEDNVRIWLDTYDDRRRAYILGFNPLGIQQDGIYTEGQNADYSVDIVMESKGVIEDWGWSVEVKIPFKSLRYSAGKGKLWGFNVARNIDRFNDELDAWMPQDKNISGFLIQSGKITGFDNIKTERTLEIVPTATIGETGSRAREIPQSIADQTGILDAGKFVNQPIKPKLGATIKFGITPNITLDAAINPDFAEIEADAPVVTANQRFPIFFEEKRPFFLEGVEIFQSPLQVFYSRTIVSPEVAAKLTGKIGGTSFGFLAASDKAPGDYSDEERRDSGIRPFINEFLDKKATFGIVRVKHDIGKENNLGFFGTYRSFPKQHNILGGFDGRFKINPRTTTTFQAVGTSSRRCFFDAEFDPVLSPAQARSNSAICGSYYSSGTYNRYRTGDGFGYYYKLDYTEKNRGFYIEASGRTRDYRADAGFTKRTNTNSFLLAGRLSTEAKPQAKLIRLSFQPFARINYDWRARSQNALLGYNLNFNLQHNTFVHFENGVGYERLFEEEFGLKRSPTRSGAFFGAPERSTYQKWVSADITSQLSKKYAVEGSFGTFWNSFDFDFGGGNRFPRVSPAALANLNGLDPGPGREFDIGLSFEAKPIDPLRISLDYQKSTLTRNDTKRTTFDSNIFTLRSTYQFTRFTFVRARLDYDTLQSRARGQLLFGWNPNPGTALYVGYNDDLNYNGFNPYNGELEPGFARNGRTFFIRASYLFRKSF